MEFSGIERPLSSSTPLSALKLTVGVFGDPSSTKLLIMTVLDDFRGTNIQKNPKRQKENA
jgi:hypothetical protein